MFDLVTLTVRFNDLQQLVGRPLPKQKEKLNQLLYLVKCELTGSDLTESIQPDAELNIENSDSNRPDIWSPEGIARALRGLLGYEVGLVRYDVGRRPIMDVNVDSELEKIRPFIGCAVAHHPRLSEDAIGELIQFQERLDRSYGRNRRRSSVGFYDFDLITHPLRYTTSLPDETRFVPLNGTEPLSLREILDGHPKGLTYEHILKPFKRLPIILDSAGRVLSFPPIINSDDLGRVTSKTRNILVEVTGTSHETVNNILTLLATTLMDRGAKISCVRIHYPYRKRRVETLPNLKPHQLALPLEYLRSSIGINLTASEARRLLRKSRYDAVTGKSKQLKVMVPCYRLDVLHPIDLIEDVAIAYGLNRLKPKWIGYGSVGNLSPIEEFSDTVRELMIGLGYQEILTFQMTTPENLFTRMNKAVMQVVEVSNPKLSTMTCLRSWLLPSLMLFLSHNTHVAYPQRIFEVGECTIPAPKYPNRALDQRKLSGVTVHSRANFTEIKSNLQSLMLNLGLTLLLTPLSDPTFIEGRAGAITIDGEEAGVMGELHPQVLENWGLENPAAAVELDLTRILKGLRSRDVAEAPKQPTSERAKQSGA